MRKVEAVLLGSVAVGLLSFMLSDLSHAPRIVVAFGLLAGAIAGAQVWEARQRRE